jgi:hypothetical protein
MHYDLYSPWKGRLAPKLNVSTSALYKKCAKKVLLYSALTLITKWSVQIFEEIMCTTCGETLGILPEGRFKTVLHYNAHYLPRFYFSTTPNHMSNKVVLPPKLLVGNIATIIITSPHFRLFSIIIPVHSNSMSLQISLKRERRCTVLAFISASMSTVEMTTVGFA